MVESWLANLEVDASSLNSFLTTTININTTNGRLHAAVIYDSELLIEHGVLYNYLRCQRGYPC